jgi:hypothetical protein
MGVSHARGYYEMETRAFRDDYYLHDVDGKSKPEGFPSFREQGAPEMLKIGFVPEAVLEKWKEFKPVSRNQRTRPTFKPVRQRPAYLTRTPI